MPRLTVASVEKIGPQQSRCEIPDTLVPGLYLVVQPSGRKSWAARYRVQGRTRKLTLGSYPALPLDQARVDARAALLEAQRGNDPTVTKRAGKDDAAKFEAAVEAFLRVHKQGRATPRQAKRSRPPRERTVAECKRYLEGLVDDWGDLPLGSITKAMVQKKLDALAKKPVAANRTHVYLKMFFEWAVFRDRVAASPVAWEGSPEEARTRTLSVDELRVFWKATGELAYPFGPFFRLVLLTGQRKNEVAQLPWSEISDGTWTLPGERTKNGLANVLPLPEQALAILKQAPRMGSYAFTTTGDTPISGFSRAAANLRKAMGDMPPWTIHDLRRTMSTLMHDELGTEPHIVEAILNHVSGARGGVAGTYNRAQYIDRKRDALAAWGQYVDGL